MKKMLAVLSVLGITAVLTGCSDMKVDNYQKNIQDFKENLASYTAINKVQSTKVKVGNYLLSTEMDEKDNKNAPTIKVEIDETETGNLAAENSQNNETKQQDSTKIETPIEDKQNTINEVKLAETDTSKTDTAKADTDTAKTETSNTETDDLKVQEQEKTTEQISTLYSVSDQIDDCCQDFVTLKQNLTDAITETQRLIEKVNNKEIELTPEQKLLITEQSKQLKNLGRQLSRSTTELAISLSDINDMMLNNSNVNDLSLKYMIVLDNLINGNEMLENGLYSLNLINSMFNASAANLPPNNTGRILYGFRRNNEQPIVKDYLIDNEGNIKENTENNTANAQQSEENPSASSEKEGNIDTMQNRANVNIDTYHNNNRNIDSFFNTALLDNEFMYGNGYGYGPMANGGLMYGYGNPNGNYANRNYTENPNYSNGTNLNDNINNTNYGVFNRNNTPNTDTTNHQKPNKKSKKFKLTKNIDSYKDADTPTLSTRFSNIKKAVSGFFNKFQKRPKENPVFRFNPNEESPND